MKPRNYIQAILIFLLVLQNSSAKGNPFPYKDVGDGQAATSVILTLVDGVVSDSQGNLYIAHRSKNRIRKVGPDGIITTIAGTGFADFGGDGGPALKAHLNFPAGMALDAEGNLYIADRNNHRIRKVDSKGIVTTISGTGVAGFGGDGGPAVEATLNFPSDLEIDSQGNLYISDRSNNRIRKIDSQGIITTIVGMGLPGYGGDYGSAKEAFLKYPFGIALDDEGNLYIADRGNNRIRKVDASGTITTMAGDGTHSFSGDYGPATQSSLAYPTDVAVDATGKVYIADRNNNRIRMVDTQGVITTVMGTGESEYNGDNEIASESNLHLPLALILDRENNLIVVDRNHFRIRSIDLYNKAVKTVAGNGNSLFRGNGGPGRGATLGSPSGIVIDGKGNILFTDKQHHRIRFLDSANLIHSFAGNGSEGNEGDGGSALLAALFLPSQMTLDNKGNLYFAGRQGNGWIIRKIDSEGRISRFAGNGMGGNSGDGGAALMASFNALSDIAVDQAGNMYISDMTSGFIRRIDSRGMIASFYGVKLSKLAQEVHVNGMVIDKAGSLIFSDSGSSKVRKVDADGTVSLVAGTGDFRDYGDGGPALQAGIRSPGGLAIGPDGSLYVAESQTSRIRKIDLQGNISRFAGTGEPGFSGDGGPATEAKLKSPYRMVFDTQGNLYFTDRDNNRIRRIDSRGIITTVAGHGNIGWLQDGLEVRITVHNFP